MKSRAERGHHRLGLVRRHPAVEVMDMGGCLVTPAASLEQPAVRGEVLGVCCTGQDCSQHSRSRAGDLGRDAACPAGWIGTAAPASETWSPGSSLAEGSGTCDLGCHIPRGRMCPEAVPAWRGAGRQGQGMPSLQDGDRDCGAGTLPSDRLPM